MAQILNIKVISKVISFNLFIVSLAYIVCVGVAMIYHESILPFILSIAICCGTGIIFFFFSKEKKKQRDLLNKDAIFTVTISWLILALVGTLPYLLSGSIHSFVDAFFESASGFTTTGSSILTDIEALPKSVLFWRSMTHWIGGIGIIILVIVILPSLKIGGYRLFSMESSLDEKIKPRIISVGRRILVIYVSLTTLETVFLLLGGMNLFESVCHSFGTIATGGFSPKNTSIADYSPYIQYVIMIFMALSGINFAMHYYFLKRDFRKINENEELKFYIAITCFIGLIITAALFFDMHKPLEEAFRESFFQVISIITCTGFASADYLQWPVYAWTILFLAMFLGGCMGSTAGGIKMVRHLVIFKNIKYVLQRLVHPKAVLNIKVNNKILTNETKNTVLTFIILYILIFAVGSLLVTASGADPVTSSSAVATCMAGIGPGLNKLGPVCNFAHLTDFAKILLVMLMIIGRLEIYTIIALFSRDFWRK